MEIKVRSYKCLPIYKTWINILFIYLKNLFLDKNLYLVIDHQSCQNTIQT